MRLALVLAVLIGSGPKLRAADEPASAADLARIFRGILVPNLPQPIVRQNMGWGHQENMAVGLKWESKGILLKPEIQKKLENDGVWRRIAVTADAPDRLLNLTVRDVKSPQPGVMTFVMAVDLPVHVKFEQQLWRRGIRLYSGETRARCRAALVLQCETTSRFEKKPAALLPEMVIRMRAKEAKLSYYDFAVEHTAGVGGDLAKTLGEAVIQTVKTLQPSLEKDLLAKANTAIVKACDTKEVHLGLSKLFDKK